MSLYSETAADVTASLKEYGVSTSLRQTTLGAYDPTNGNAVPTTGNVSVTALVIDYPIRYIDGTKILAGDKQAYVAPGTAPKVNDELLWMGEWWRIVSVETLAPAGVPVLYTLQVRK